MGDIAPDPQRRAEREYDLAEALQLIESEAKFDKSRLTPAKHRELLQTLANTLRKAIVLAVQERQQLGVPMSRRTPWDARVDDLKRCLEQTEKAADYVSKFEIAKGAPRTSTARIAAVWQASRLLKKYGPRPTLYRDGPWHNLARALLGKPGKPGKEADLFDYMEVQRKIEDDQIVG